MARPTEPPTSPRDQNSAAPLARAISRAENAIAWERTWPHIVRVGCAIGLFLAASWAGLWLALPPAGRIVGLVLFTGLVIAAIWPARRWRWPSRADALARLDRGTGLKHRPATALMDTLATPDPTAQALWQAERARVLASLPSIRAGLPTPRLPLHDGFALRAIVLLAVVATFIAASGERSARILSAFAVGGAIPVVETRLDAWVTPPPYTGRPPVILTAARDAAAQPTTLSVPAGSVLTIRTSAATLDVALTGGVTDAAPGSEPQDSRERRYTIAGDGTAHVRTPGGQPTWAFVAMPDRAPTIALAKEPERQARGALQLAYKLDDDYGVTAAQATFALRRVAPNARPLFKSPELPLALPNARTRTGVGQTVKDLTEDPYAGADVTLTLSARDEAGNEGKSEPAQLRLPERLFTKPLARALIEQRRMLALDAEQNGTVQAAIAALMIAPELFTPEAGHYLGLREIAHQMDAARSDDQLREVVASLWALAVAIEDADTSDAEKALRAAQEALKQALERGASDQEIKQLTDNLRAALDKFLKQLAEQMQKNPQQLARPLDQNSRVMRQQDLNSMIERMERLSRSGDKDAARQLLEQMQRMLENLQMAQPGQGGDDDMQQTMNELNDVIRKQQLLRDKTFKQGQDNRRERPRGRQKQGDPNGGDPSMGDLQQDQQALRERLQKLQEELARRGMGPSQRGEKGQRGQKGQGQQGQGQPGQGQGQQPGQGGDDGDGEDGFGEADSAMGDAGGQLGDGNADGATDSQGRAIDSLRKGADKLAQSMQPGNDDGEGQDGPGNRPGRQQSNGTQTDPLGRPLRSRDYGDDLTVKIPGEIDVQRARRILEELRRRLGESARPQLELDYIERLLRDY